MENSFFQMEIYMRANIRTVSLLEKANTFGKIKLFMKDSSYKDLGMEEEQ